MHAARRHRHPRGVWAGFAVAVWVVAAPLANSAALVPKPSAGAIILVSTGEAAEKGNGHSQHPSISADGRWVAFRSNATNLHPNDTDGVRDVFVKDLTSGELILASVNAQGVKSNADCRNPVMSGDGGRVAFETTATNLDPRDVDPDEDIYVKDLLTGKLFLASTNDDGVKGDGNSFDHAFSDDGDSVAFVSWASNLDPADHDGNTDIYVKNLATGDIVLASTSAKGANSNSGSDYPSLSADGGIVAFESAATNLVLRDWDGVTDVYVKDLTTGAIRLESVSERGEKGDAFSGHAFLSADGSRVAFQSYAANLDPLDHDAVSDIFVKDLRTGAIDVASDSSQGRKGNGDSVLPSLDGAGTRVAFVSVANNLDPRDLDEKQDIYVKDLGSEELILASISLDGEKGNGFSGGAWISRGGDLVAIISSSTNLVRQDHDVLDDVYVKQI